MIVFDLRCTDGHVFEAWFASGAAYDEQRGKGLLQCPICGGGDVAKAVMAPNVAAKGNARSDVAVAPAPSDAPDPVAIKQAMRQLAAMQAKALEKSQWVGRAFADRARAMHTGEESTAPIHGQTTPAEAKALAEEGVPCAPLPFPIVPPDALN